MSQNVALLTKLFTAEGNILKATATGFKTGHEPKHESSSGTCVTIDAHKETHEPAGGGRARSAKILDRFAIDYALCMYCGICVEACPFDALFWSREFDYAEYDIHELTHEKERLEEWTYTVLPPPALEEGAEAPNEVAS